MRAPSVSSGFKRPALRAVASQRAVSCRAEPATLSEVRKLLDSRGWDRAWIDGVTERVSRRQVQPTLAHMGAVLDAVEQVGLKGAQVEHAFTLAWSVWNRTPEQITAVAQYLSNIGAKDPAKILFHNPKLLEYDVSADGSELENGPRARAKVTFTKDDDGEELVLVSFYSKTATFNTAPLSPYQP